MPRSSFGSRRSLSGGEDMCVYAAVAHGKILLPDNEEEDYEAKLPSILKKFTGKNTKRKIEL